MSAAVASARAAAVVAPLLARRLGRGATTAPGRWKSVQPTKQRGGRAASSAVSSDAAPSSGVAAYDKVCVITGANTGLGFISAGEIARKPGYRVVLACRNLSKAGKAADSIFDATGYTVDVMQLDLSELASVDAFVQEFTGKYDRCDVLMNNAGVMALPERSLTPNGIETQMGTNHMGHFYLTSKMMPTILSTPGRPRIVNLTSVAHEFGHVDFENINSDGPLGYLGAGWLTYGRTKLANMYFTYELHRRLREFGGDGNRIDVNCVHPGVVDTELPRSLSVNFYPILKTIGGLITPEEGARGQIDVATGPKYEGISGKYVAEQSGPSNPGGAKGTFAVAESSSYSYDVDAAARLWKRSKAMTGAAWDAIGEGALPSGQAKW